MSTTTTVVHCKREKYDVYIGRPSKWGNPFRIGAGCTRAQAIELYKKHIRRLYYTGKITNDDLRSLQGKRLGCWCKPLDCHGDVIISFMNSVLGTPTDTPNPTLA